MKGSLVVFKMLRCLRSSNSPKLFLGMRNLCTARCEIFYGTSKKCGQVLGVELLSQAVCDAKHNAETNGITNCDFFVGKAEDILSSVLNRASKEDIIAVVDPPRAGLHHKALAHLRKTEKLTKLVFLSCDPKGASRNFVDLGRATSKTYQGAPLVPMRAVPVDMFPHTSHCELVVYFERLPSVVESNITDSGS